MNELFLSDAELVKLTGYAWKSKQIQWLRAEAIPFRTAATGHPVVTRAAIEGRSVGVIAAEPLKAPWVPRVLGA